MIGIFLSYKAILWNGKRRFLIAQDMKPADAITAFKSCLTKQKRGVLSSFHVSFQSKKHQQSQAFRVNKKTLNPSTLSTQTT